MADKIVLLDSNEDSLQARADYIQTAEESIRAQYFTIEDDSLSRAALALLRDAAHRGRSVKILVDSMHNLMLRETMAAVLMNLSPEKRKNIEIREYNTFNLFRPFRYTKRMHDKSLIIDGKYMISGGRNIANGYYGVADKTKKGEALPVYEDSDALILESKSIAVAAKYFDDLWNSKFVSKLYLYDYSVEQLDSWSCRKNEYEGDCESSLDRRVKNVQAEEKKLTDFLIRYNTQTDTDRKSLVSNVITDWSARAIEVDNIDYLFDDVNNQASNLKKPENSIGTQLYAAIARAKESVTIITPYLVVTPEQEALFITLKNNGVKVTVVTNSKGANDVTAAHVGYEKTKHLAINAGVNLHEYQGPDTLHAKMVLIDHTTLFIGSFNWDFRSQNLNREVGILATLPATKTNDLTSDVRKKFAGIIRKTCKADTGACNVMRGDAMDKLSAEQYQALTEAFTLRQNNKGTLYRVLFPLIKKQL